MDRFDKTKAWGDVKKAYIFQTVIVLIFVAIIFSVVIPRVFPPASKNNSVDAIEKIVVRMILAGFDNYEIYSVGRIKQFNLIVNPYLRRDVESMSDKQIVEFYDIGISELNSLRDWAKKKELCKDKLLREQINHKKINEEK